jgi:hypothetical protein
MQKYNLSFFSASSTCVCDTGLSVLVKKAQEAQIVDIATRLCRQILEGSAELR